MAPPPAAGGASGVPDRWLEVELEVTDEIDRTVAAETLVMAGARAVVESDRGLKTHFAEPAAGPEPFLRRLESSLIASGLAAPLITWRWQRHEDWAILWRQGLGPRRVGRRIVVHPSWTESPSGPGDIDLTIDPGIAFGTAEHATTRLALSLLESRVESGQWVADVGAGTGILGIAAARLGAARVLAYDTDPYAWAVTRENALRNGVPALIQVVEGPMEEDAPRVDGLVVNIEWVRLAPLIPSLSTRVRGSGWMVLSGVLIEQRETARALVRDLGWATMEEAVEEEWWAVALSRAAT